MSGRRRFGSVVSRTSRDGKRRYVEARYQPPVWAYAKWPDLPKHYSRRFDADYTAMAAAWLADVERLCFVKFLWAVSAFLLVRLSGCF